VIRLSDLRQPAGATWASAARWRPPLVDEYAIAQDCLAWPRDRVAVVDVAGDDHRQVTFGELADRAARLANHLVASGVAPGERVGIKLSQSADMAVAVLGVLRAGAVVVPLSNVLAADGVRHRVADAEPRLVVAAGVDAERELLADAGVRLLTTRELDEVSSTGSTTAPSTSGAADDPALLLYTSGTTGKSKGVLQAQRFVLGHHAVDLALDRVRDGDVAYTPVDWTWAGGLLLGLLVPLAHGVTVVAHREPRFDAAQVLAVMQRTGVSIGLMPPTVLRMLRASGVLDGGAVAETRLRCFVTGAEAVEPELIEWGAERGVVINNAYGQTEANALVGHAETLGPLDQRTMGRPYPGHDVQVLDDDLQPVGDGTAGQLAVRGDDLVCMLGYWRNPDATATKVAGGWLLTGDTVQRDADGTLRFCGRNDDIIKSGAYRLGPAEIEGAVLRVPAVVDCAVVGLPDPIRGEVVSAVVVLEAGATEADVDEQIRASVRQTVGAHAYPRRIIVVDGLPRTTTNKVDRAALRASLRAEGAPT
jgi:acetyl-CoA synthetase